MTGPLLISLTILASAGASPPELICPEPSDTGAYQLKWKGPDGADYRLEEDGRTLYRGPDRASSVSGRGAGEYLYRVAVKTDNGWSFGPSCTVRVSPPSLALAFTFLGMGFLVFLVVLLVVIAGHRAHRRGDIG